MMKRIFSSALMMLFTMNAYAGQHKSDFSAWVDHLERQAVDKGYRPETVKAAFAVIDRQKPNQKIIKLDNYQPEYVENFASYYQKRITPQLIKNGQKHYNKNKVFLDNLEKKYHVPGRYLIALWGMESRYGEVQGTHNILNATATLSWTRRHDFFTQQFFAALTVMEQYNRRAEQMVGSWASAMGHMQFIPTTLIQYGKDGNGDNRIDIWNNTQDAFTSAAYYLYRRGWKPDLLWGREVKITAQNFNYNQSGIKYQRKLREWHKKGVKRIDGRPLPQHPTIQGALVVPMGVSGPKFLVYNNFHRLLNWNQSIHNALAVSLLANAIDDRPALQHRIDTGKTGLRKDFVKKAQRYLQQLGHQPGKADGAFGSKSRRALKDYQKTKQLPADGYLDIKVFQKLQQDAENLSTVS